MSVPSKEEERWQAYDGHGLPVKGKGLTKDEAYGGMLHAASHVWLWRRAADGSIEVLLQRRAPEKRTWPNCWDISAAGHVDLGETPLKAARRETREELGVVMKSSDLSYAGCYRQNLHTNATDIENEFCFIYLLELRKEVAFTLEKGGVASVEWKPLATFQQEVLVGTPEEKAAYVPHGVVYYALIVEATTRQAEKA